MSRFAAFISVLALWVGAPLRAEPPPLAELVDQLDDADFSRREAAAATLGKQGFLAIDALVSGAAAGSPEVASRAVHLLERLMQSGEDANLDAADAALRSLAEGEQPHAAALARAALLRNSSLREHRAVVRITELGGQVQYGAKLDQNGTPLYPDPHHEDDLRPRTVLLSREWSGGIAGLDELKRLSHLKFLGIYLEKGSSVTLADVESLASDLHGLSVQHRGPFLGVKQDSVRPGQCIIGGVLEGGPAEKAGLQQRDNVIAVDGSEITQFYDLVDRLKAYEFGDTVTVTVERQNQTLDIPVELTSWHLPLISDDDRTSGVVSGRGIILPESPGPRPVVLPLGTSLPPAVQ